MGHIFSSRQLEVQVLGPMVSKSIGQGVINRLCKFEVQLEVVRGVANLDEKGWSFVTVR